MKITKKKKKPKSIKMYKQGNMCSNICQVMVDINIIQFYFISNDFTRLNYCNICIRSVDSESLVCHSASLQQLTTRRGMIKREVVRSHDLLTQGHWLWQFMWVRSGLFTTVDNTMSDNATWISSISWPFDKRTLIKKYNESRKWMMNGVNQCLEWSVPLAFMWND